MGIQNTNRNAYPNALVILNEQLSIVPGNAHFYIFTGQILVADDKLKDSILQSIQTRTAPVRLLPRVKLSN